MFYFHIIFIGLNININIRHRMIFFGVGESVLQGSVVVVRYVCDTSSLGFWLTVWDGGKVTGPQIAKGLEKIRFEGTEKLFSLIKQLGSSY